jgi:hypothetical protein
MGNFAKAVTDTNFASDVLGSDKPVLVDLNAIKFQIGYMFKFSLLSIIGIFVSLYFFRWYR